MTSSPRPSRASLLVVMSFAGSALVVPATAGAAPPVSGLAPPTGVATPERPTAKVHGRKKKKLAKASPKTASRARSTTSSRTKRRRAGGQHALAASPHGGAAPIAKLAALPPLVPSPGPSSTPEALRAQDRAARGQIERAASAARRPALTDRWQTVSFLLSGVDGTRYPEATFWRALAAYRRGDVDGGDKIRLRSSPLTPTDTAVLDGERSTATLLARAEGNVGASPDQGTSVATQPGSPGFRRAAFIEGAGGPSLGGQNDAPYTGPAPIASAPGVAAN